LDAWMIVTPIFKLVIIAAKLMLFLSNYDLCRNRDS